MTKRAPFIFFSLAVAVGCTSQKSDSEIRIGHVGSMTGAEATFGQSTDQAIRLAVDEINQSGGIQGRKIRLITVDNQGKPEEAASAVNQLVDQYGVVAVLGEVASSRSLAMAPVAQSRKVVMITPSSTNPKVTQVGDYIFRVCFVDSFQGYVMARFARENLGLKKVAILKDLKSDYSVGLSQFFRETFEKKGGQIVSEQSYQSGDVDFKAQLVTIKQAQPEGLFIPGYYTEVGLIARQVQELGLKVVLLGGDGWDSGKLLEIGQNSLEGGYFSNHYFSENPDPRVQKFVAAFKQRYGQIPDGLAASGYDAAWILFEAMKKASKLDSEAIRQSLTQIKDFPGVTGTITIDEQRNARKSAVILKVEKGRFVYVTTIHPE